MKNREKFAKEILDIACSCEKLAMRKADKCLTECVDLNCDDCFFSGTWDCCEAIRKWAESEYIEQPKISKKDRAFLDYLKDYKYMARDKNGDLYAYTTIPIRTTTYWRGATCKNLCSLDIYFPMVKWSDEALWVIDILKKLEVVDSYE
jgi:hypothetical protein|nr:MAG TPA: hypothetical protein [Caudoviricetes sp.]